ncbi:MAG TPA: ferric reductase-like transmembrane domain-containing protein [Kofleriaceae bacterium]|jgi:ferredoxin-NADP reductase/DMSO/TMAO reductase YedYZ heme-binding membrane subunit|nr:ferric reductase-like transmembrane domain-containing protein [Kofleriaceae bacterium]
MSTSKLVDNKLAKLIVIVNACVPAAILAWDALHHQLGVNEVNFAIRTTGLLGLVCLVSSLAITPLRWLTGWQQLIAIRRNLGVAGFMYIAVHFFIFFWWDRERSVSSTVHEIIDREYLWFGFGALLAMVPLAITSTDAMVSRLGARRWKTLHRLNYAIVLAGGIHYLLLVKSDLRAPLVFLSVTGALLGFRVLSREIDLRRELVATKLKLKATPAKAKRSFWSGELKIARIFRETPDVKTFRMVSPDGGPLPFDHVAGQYLNLALTIDGKQVKRSYTIASAPNRAYVEISVKRAADGYGSKHLHDTWHEGDLVKVSAPSGKFIFAGHEGDRIVLIAGGIGITPMMSVTRSLTDRGWRGEIYLVFAVRKRADIVFETELEYLRARSPKLHVLVTLTDPDASWTGAHGRITADALRAFIPDFTRGPIMVCGPDPMMTATRALLVGMGIPDAEIHQEAFVSPPAAVAEQAASEAGVDDPPLPDGEVATLTFAKSGVTAQVTNATTVLEAAEDAGVDIPFECRSGICGQCKTRLVHGKVRMDAQDALTNQDRSRGLVLACQSHCTRDCTVDA